MDEEPQLKWSAPFAVAPPSAAASKSLRGDKILLPQSALEQLLAAAPAAPHSQSYIRRDPFNPYREGFTDRNDAPYRDSNQLPNPLMFKIVNQANGNAAYAGIREFSADEGQLVMPTYLMEALGITLADFGSEGLDKTESGQEESQEMEIETSPRVTIHAQQLPKGTYVRLRPLEAGYNPDDWKPLLERQLRESYTTLTKESILTVRGVKGEEYRFLVDKFLPEGNGICVVDTDLEVDIEALNEEQARETLRQIMAKSQPGTAGGTSGGGAVDIWKAVEGQVLPGEYVDYALPAWDRAHPLTIELSGFSPPDALDLFVSPKSARQRALPRDHEHVLGDFSAAQDGIKSITIQPTNIELEGAEELLISVYGSSHREGTDGATKFSLRAGGRKTVTNGHGAEAPAQEHSPDDEQCSNCYQWIPKRTMMLHQNFCLRNNTTCPKCKTVFKKGSQEWEDHWHCDFDDAFGDSAASRRKHDSVRHTEQTCPSCDTTVSSLVELALHKTSVCPGKLILCRFCHLEVPQEGDPVNPSAEVLLSGLTAHELADGARTTNCHLCNKIVRLRDMSAHMKHHELDKVSRQKPEICRNATCGRTLHGVGPNGAVGAGTRMGQGPGNDLGLCSLCYGPLYVSMHDPEGKALRRRIERKYLSQLTTGCRKAWCGNEWCKTGRANLGLEPMGATSQAAMPLIRPLVAAIHELQEPMHFCVDEGSQKRRRLAEMLAGEGVFEVEWCIAACDAGNGDLDKAREWLRNWAPTMV